VHVGWNRAYVDVARAMHVAAAGRSHAEGSCSDLQHASAREVACSIRTDSERYLLSNSGRNTYNISEVRRWGHAAMHAPQRAVCSAYRGS
jgi:hypothetical protein